MSERKYALEERVGSAWVGVSPDIARFFSSRDKAEAYLVTTLSPQWPERKFRVVWVLP